MTEERKPLIAAAAERNKEPILETLKTILPSSEPLEILEISSGTGQHVVHFARGLPNTQWQPSDIDPAYIKSISTASKNLPNVKPPIVADVMKPVPEWQTSSGTPLTQNNFDAVYCANLVHISPWECTLGLFSSAAYLLKRGGTLITYGPYAFNGVLSPESNIQFDAYLKRENPEWGVRDLKDMIRIGQENGLEWKQTIDMPANNKVLIFKNEGKK